MPTYLRSFNNSTLIIFLGFATIFAFGPYLNYGEFWWTDESRHAMDGVYFLDLLKDLPLSNLYEYTVQYFARYPALGLTWYLPFFAFIESLFFAVFGISEWVARLTVGAFTLVGMIAWYAWVSKYWGKAAAFLSWLLIISNPIVLLWMRSVMLELPAVALMLLTIVFYFRFLEAPTHKNAVYTGIAISAMLLTKQTTILLLPVLLFYPFISGQAGRLWNKQVIWAYIAIIFSLSVVFFHAVQFGATALGSIESNSKSLLNIGRWTLNARVVIDAYPWPFILAFLTGMGFILIQRIKKMDYFIILWIISWYIAITIFNDDPDNIRRYTTYLTPALALLAVRPLELLVEKPYLVRAWWLLICSVFAVNIYLDLTSQQPYLSGYRQASDYIRTLPKQGTVLFCCKHDGNFTFHSRASNPSKDDIILRADKILISMSVQQHFGVKSYTQDQNALFQILDRYGVGFIIVEDRDLVRRKEFKLLLETLEGDKFALLHELPVDSNLREFSNLNIRIYSYLDKKPVKNDEIVIPMPHINRELRLPIN